MKRKSKQVANESAPKGWYWCKEFESLYYYDGKNIFGFYVGGSYEISGFSGNPIHCGLKHIKYM